VPSGGTTCTCTASSCSNCNAYSGGAADGLNYGIWESGTGGNITYFTNAHAFSASWGPSSADFLAHVGLDYNGTKSYTTYGKIVAQIAESKSGTAGGYSSIGMYGWLQSPCVEWYIVDDAYQTMPTQKSSVTATIDGGTYYLISKTTTGTAGANACSGSVSSWTQMWSVRSTARQCGTITVSDHFAAWANQGWSVGNVSSIHINVEVGGGTGSIQFPTASVSVNN
jgi:glycosyl hydrolase family 11